MKTSPWLIPLLIILFIALGLQAATTFSVPSVSMVFAQDAIKQANSEKVVMTVDGVKCVDTAKGAANTLKELEGVFSFDAYASYNRIEVTFDPKQTSIQKIVEAIEGPVYDEESQQFYFHLYTVLTINDEKVNN